MLKASLKKWQEKMFKKYKQPGKLSKNSWLFLQFHFLFACLSVYFSNLHLTVEMQVTSDSFGSVLLGIPFL